MRARNAIVRGVGVAIVAAASAVAVAQASPSPWFPEEPQGYYTQTWHDGFRAGGVAANLDINAELLPDLSRHVEYRNPDLSPMSTEDFQDGFRFAYEAVVDFRVQHIAYPKSAAYGWGAPD